MGAFGPIDSKEPNSNNPEIRAAAIIGHHGLPAEHAVYLPIFVNRDGEVLSGDKKEVFTFAYKPKKVELFWSVTRYSGVTRNTLPGRNDIFNAYNTTPDDEGNDMYPRHPNPAPDEELAYRRQRLEEEAIRTNSGRRGAWFRPRRRPR